MYYLRLIVSGMFVLILMSPATHAWQGRMHALGNPHGLVSDESDFLTHPSLARHSDELTLFADFTFSYRDIHNNGFGPASGGALWLPGYEDSLFADIGVLIPLQTGILGFVASGEHDWMNLDGNQSDPSFPSTFKAETLDTEATFGAMYAFDVTDSYGFGLRIDLSYHDEWSFNERHIINRLQENTYFFHLERPYDRGYGEALFTLSADGVASDITYAISMHGGFLIAGYENLIEETTSYPSGFYRRNEFDAGYNGFSIGCDIWVVYQAAEDIRFPFVFSVDYSHFSSMSRETSITTAVAGIAYDWEEYDIYGHSLSLSAKAGIELLLTDTFRLGGGLSYTFARDKSYIDFAYGFLGNPNTQTTIEQSTSHTFSLNLNGDVEVIDNVQLLCGLNVFFSDLAWNADVIRVINGLDNGYDYNMHGYAYGLNGSIGLSVEYDSLVLEPFVAAGIESKHLGGELFYKSTSASYDYIFDYDAWFITTGVSIGFDGF